MAHHSATVLILALAIVAANGCGLFSTRNPASPENQTTSDDLALSASEVITTLQLAISLHDPNLYMSVIADSFEYESTPQAYPAGGSLFENWSFNQESNFIRNLLAVSLLPPDSTSSLALTSVQEQEGADEAVYLESYRLEVHTLRGDLPTVYEGLAELTIHREEDSGWRIRRWGDDVSGDSATMSQLRASL